MKKAIIITVVILAVALIGYAIWKNWKSKQVEVDPATGLPKTDTSEVDANTFIETVAGGSDAPTTKPSELSISDPMHPDFQAGIQSDGSFVG